MKRKGILNSCHPEEQSDVGIALPSDSAQILPLPSGEEKFQPETALKVRNFGEGVNKRINSF